MTSKLELSAGRVLWPNLWRTRSPHSSSGTSSQMQAVLALFSSATPNQTRRCNRVTLQRSTTMRLPLESASFAAATHFFLSPRVSWLITTHPNFCNLDARVLLPDPGRPTKTKTRNGWVTTTSGGRASPSKTSGPSSGASRGSTGKSSSNKSSSSRHCPRNASSQLVSSEKPALSLPLAPVAVSSIGGVAIQLSSASPRH
mmetsp:Transcript_3746/g.8699  ORF Transcript_3746/g.8699 Transcript_3746/m.8699 type:complete len:200 (+) Transcript_3746:826-1425(+)